MEISSTIKFRDKEHYMMFYLSSEAGRIMLGLDRDFKYRKRKPKNKSKKGTK